MMIGVVGTNFKFSSIEMRERLTTSFPFPVVALRTCHRVEWYFASKTPIQTQQQLLQELEKTSSLCSLDLFYSFFGLDCIRHLTKVVAGIDSRFLGETEIQGQVKLSYEEARKKIPLPKELHRLFQKSLHNGKVIRQSLLPCQAELQTLEHTVLSTVEKKYSEKKRILFVGCSTVGKRVSEALRILPHEQWWCNRTLSKAHAFAKTASSHGVLPWESLHSSWGAFDCVIASTGSPHYILKDTLSYTPQTSLFIDLGMPRNIDPLLAQPNIPLLNIDSLFPSQGELEAPHALSIKKAIDSRSEHLWQQLIPTFENVAPK